MVGPFFFVLVKLFLATRASHGHISCHHISCRPPWNFARRLVPFLMPQVEAMRVITMILTMSLTSIGGWVDLPRQILTAGLTTSYHPHKAECRSWKKILRPRNFASRLDPFSDAASGSDVGLFLATRSFPRDTFSATTRVNGLQAKIDRLKNPTSRSCFWKSLSEWKRWRSWVDLSRQILTTS